MIRMRDKNLNFIQFEKQVEDFLYRKFLLPELLRTAVVITPTFLEQYFIVYPRKFKEIQGLIVISYYCPESLKWRIWLDLNEMSFSHLNEKQRIEIQILLSSKENMLKYLFLTNRYTSHEIFGNILGEGLKTLKFLRIYRRSTKIVYRLRKRGYDDKGSLRPKEKWLPDSDYTFTNLQNEKEKRSQLRQSVINAILTSLENTDSRKI